MPDLGLRMQYDNHHQHDHDDSGSDYDEQQHDEHDVHHDHDDSVSLRGYLLASRLHRERRIEVVVRIYSVWILRGRLFMLRSYTPCAIDSMLDSWSDNHADLFDDDFDVYFYFDINLDVDINKH